MVEWNKIKAWLKKFVRKVLQTYKSEIKKYVAEQVDAQLINLQRAVSEEVRKKIKNEVIVTALENQIDIYTASGAETVKSLIDEYIDKLSGE